MTVSAPAVNWTVFLIVCAIVRWLVVRRERLHTTAPRTYKGPEGSVVIPPENLINPTPTVSPAPAPSARPRWLSATDFCGCCGRHAVVGQLWCFDCAFHIDAHAQQPHDRTWYAQHGTICPFTDLDEPRDYAADAVPEGLGVTPAPRPSRVSASGQWSAGERDLWDEISRRVAR